LPKYASIPLSRRIAVLGLVTQYQPPDVNVLHNTRTPTAPPTQLPTAGPTPSEAQKLAASLGLSVAAVTAIAVVFSLLGVAIILGILWYFNRHKLRRLSEKVTSRPPYLFMTLTLRAHRY